MAGSYDGVEPVLRVEVIRVSWGPTEVYVTENGSIPPPRREMPKGYTIQVEGRVLPVFFRSRSEALRIAERLYSLLADGFEASWQATLEAVAAA